MEQPKKQILDPASGLELGHGRKSEILEYKTHEYKKTKNPHTISVAVYDQYFIDSSKYTGEELRRLRGLYGVGMRKHINMEMWKTLKG